MWVAMSQPAGCQRLEAGWWLVLAAVFGLIRKFLGVLHPSRSSDGQPETD